MSSEILELIEKSAVLYPNNIAVGDCDGDINYTELIDKIKSVSTAILNSDISKKPIAILMNRSRFVPIAMLSVAFSGNFYVVLDCDSPIDRLKKIISTLKLEAIIYENRTECILKQLDLEVNNINFESAIETAKNEKLLESAKDNILDFDPMYSIFTSGSTGVPKGALLTHRNLKSYMSWFAKCFDITENTVFGSQTPMYFSMSVSDLYAALTCGAAYQIIPKEYFAFPAKLVEFMNKKCINTIYWVPSAYGIVYKFNLFKYCKPEFLEKALFAGEVMPVKYLNYWKSYLPDVLYANLFGPTETTDICSYYKVNREFKENENLPIGVACDNCRLFVISENGFEADIDEKGELYVSSEAVAAGYYCNDEKTNEAFVQNPLITEFPQIVYKTGDIVKKNKYGELEYVGRKDFQIKHMGYRIELGEIETALNCTQGVEITVCIYDETNDMLLLIYDGKEDADEKLIKMANDNLPSYMLPEKYIRMQSLPKNMNGKIDRKEIKKIILEEK